MRTWKRRRPSGNREKSLVWRCHPSVSPAVIRLRTASSSPFSLVIHTSIRSDDRPLSVVYILASWANSAFLPTRIFWRSSSPPSS